MRESSISVATGFVPALSSARFIATLEEEARDHRAVRHPYLRALAAGSFADPAAASGWTAFRIRGCTDGSSRPSASMTPG
jgi:hypothetical protein